MWMFLKKKKKFTLAKIELERLQFYVLTQLTHFLKENIYLIDKTIIEHLMEMAVQKKLFIFQNGVSVSDGLALQ